MSFGKNRASPSINIDKDILCCRVFLENGLGSIQFVARPFGALLLVGVKGLGCCSGALFMRPFGCTQGDR